MTALLLLLSLASAADDDVYARISGGVGWLQGAHVGAPGTPQSTVLGLGLGAGATVGGSWDHGAIGARLGVAGAPWMQVQGPGGPYGARPNAMPLLGLDVRIRPGSGSWYGSGSVDFRVPFRLVGREHRSVVETWVGGATGLGLGHQWEPSSGGVALSAEVRVEGRHFWSVVSGTGLAHRPRLWFVVPTVDVGVVFGGWR